MLPPEDPERVTFGGSVDQRDNLGLRCMRTNRGKELWSEVQYEEDTRPNGVTLTGKPVWHPSPVREYVHDEGTVSQVKECTLHNITQHTTHHTHPSLPWRPTSHAAAAPHSDNTHTHTHTLASGRTVFNRDPVRRS